MEMNGYRIEVVCANDEGGIYGDIYDSVEDCKKEHPNDEVMYGFCCIPINDKEDKPLLDWLWTLEDAIEFCKNPKKIVNAYGY